nr:MAG TPA: hypothetical protein [Caudoviricetes sp.]
MKRRDICRAFPLFLHFSKYIIIFFNSTFRH